jgi:hypothetical protein
MFHRSPIMNLPQEVRIELERSIAARTHGSYMKVAFGLQSQGFAIGVKCVQRHGCKVRQKIEGITHTVQQAQAITEAAPDGRQLPSEGVMRLLQQKIFAVLACPNEYDEDTISRLVRIAAESQWSSGFPPPKRRRNLSFLSEDKKMGPV